MTQRGRALAAIAGASLALSACGDDDEGGRRADTTAHEVSPDVDADDGDGGDDSDVGDEVLAPVTCDGLGDPSLRLVQDGTALRDRDGRQVWLHGVNAGGRSKNAPFVPFAYDAIDPEAPPLSDALAAYFDRMQGWGMNVVRLVFTWEAVEPERGAYDAAYLERLDAMVDAAAARGIRVVLDNHQDVFARPYCGDGFPLWAMANPDVERPADCSTWFLGYFQNADMRRDFDRFWDGEDGLREAFEAMWTMLAERYRDHDGVIGYEIMNEPGWGSRDPNVFVAEVLTPFYTRMVEVIRAVTDEQLVFVDATGLDGVLVQTTLQRPQGDGIVFAPHFYDGPALAGVQVPDDLGSVFEAMAAWRAVGDAWQVPVLVGEFGVPYDLEGAASFIRAHWDAFDAHGLHGTQWEYSVSGEVWNAEVLGVVDHTGAERATGRELLRAYPAAVAGEVTSWRFDAESATAEIALDADGVTLVRAPARLYPGGPVVTVTKGEACTRWDEASQMLVIGGRGSLDVTLAPR